MENNNITIGIKKNISGTVAFNLEDFFGETQARSFILTTARPEINVPIKYALSLFTSSGAMHLLVKGLIVISKNKEQFFAALNEQQIVDVEYYSNLEIPTDEEIIARLNRGTAEEITELLEQFEEKVFDVATAYVDDLSSRSIKTIEEITNIALLKEE